MNRIRLSICISTLNRADVIGETLESIVPQTTGEIEIVIVDNSADSNTEKIAQQFASHCERLRYVRVDPALGMDEKYSEAVDLAQGDYCWLFTDDDLLKPGAVSAVLEATHGNYSLIVVNAEVRNEDFSVCLQPKRVDVAEDRVYRSTPSEQNQLLADLGMYLTFLGAIVIKRDVWNQREKQTYFGTLFIHLGVIFQSPLADNALFLAHPWILIRYGVAQWRARSFEIWMFQFPELIWSFPDFADWAKEKVERREPWRRWRRLLMMRAMGRYSSQEYGRWLKPRVNSTWGVVLARVIASAPIAPLNFLTRMFLSLSGKVLSLAMIDLRAWRQQSKSR
jgi:abequosyltransferase